MLRPGPACGAVGVGGVTGPFTGLSSLRTRGQRLGERREEPGLTQEDLAELCRPHRTFIGSVERGERNVSILNLRAIAQALRISLAEVFGESRRTGPAATPREEGEQHISPSTGLPGRGGQLVEPFRAEQ